MSVAIQVYPDIRFTRGELVYLLEALEDAVIYSPYFADCEGRVALFRRMAEKIDDALEGLIAES